VLSSVAGTVISSWSSHHWYAKLDWTVIRSAHGKTAGTTPLHGTDHPVLA
jgi:hypothetical protein